MSACECFKNVELLALPDNKSVELFIGNDNAFLMPDLEERVGMSHSNPHAILAPLGRPACGGASPLEKGPVKVSRVQSCDLDVDIPLSPEIMSRASRDDCIRQLEQALRDLNLQNAKIDSSQRNKDGGKFVDTHAVVQDSRFEIPVHVKIGVSSSSFG